ncbi:MAG: hypothetical protein HWQ41_25705 [Nostoc sp. NOS(2021)]|uniref:IS630 transposase-related protein n=1 Tax=Nostoc sp. NOS(2021) TaxID=2815407 RepID=UPI0025F3EC5A|nr:IS630 transposase-related protein [Nostoc sp. NOS(2021)]MBN3898537.1 hypothetical protein [Nostoc sp. NOS(2021)]
MKSDLDKHKIELAQMVEKYPDATLSEYCEYWGQTYDKWVSTSAMCRALQRQKLTQKKRRYVVANVPRKESKSSDVNFGRK